MFGKIIWPSSFQPQGHEGYHWSLNICVTSHSSIHLYYLFDLSPFFYERTPGIRKCYDLIRLCKIPFCRWGLEYTDCILTLHKNKVPWSKKKKWIFWLVWFGLVLWHINHCWYFIAKSILINLSSIKELLKFYFKQFNLA